VSDIFGKSLGPLVMYQVQSGNVYFQRTFREITDFWLLDDLWQEWSCGSVQNL